MMFFFKNVVLSLCLVFSFSYNALAVPLIDKVERQSLGIFDDFWGNTEDAFTGDNLYYHGAAFASTYAIAESGIDQNMYDWSLQNQFGNGFGDTAFVVGAIVQPIVGATLYLSDDPETRTAGAAVLQTMIIQSVYVGILKIATGRPDPVLNGDVNNANPKGTLCGNSFNPKVYFDIGGGCSWPSGHTSSAVSLVSTLYAFYPEKKWIAYVGYPASLAIGIGMVDNDEHWFSEIVAGALIGHAIGWTIGKNFRNNYDGLNKKPNNHLITPMLSSYGGVGINYTFKF